MSIATKTIVCKGETLILTNQRAVFWKAQRMLILSDVHIGKTAHFRKHGISIPDSVLKQDLKRLDILLSYFSPKTLMVVGDLFHAEYNKDVTAFQQWLQAHPTLKLVLVKGNHDRCTKQLYSGLNMDLVLNSLTIGPIHFVHDLMPAVSNDEQFCISGHIHPGVVLKGKGKQRITLPCYKINERRLILPAFSLFTGLNTKKQSETFLNYAFTEHSIFKT